VASPGDDWSLLEAGHPNVLLVGPHDATRSFLVTITPWLQPPVRRIACDTMLSLPAAAGTLVLDDVDLLPDQEQHALLQWLEITQSVPQLISLTTGPLYERVQTGGFLAALYYRLNLVHLQVDSA
jgi:sigma-54-interacting transcriptional regulator